MNSIPWRDAVAAIMALSATGAVIYLAVVSGEQSEALVAIAAGATMFYLRGRVAEPNE